MRTKEQMIEACLNGFKFNLLYYFYTRVLGYSKFPYPWKCPIPCSISWLGKEVTIELLRETAKDLCISFFDHYEENKERGYEYSIEHAGFRVTPTIIGDNMEIEGISLSFELMSHASNY